MVFRERIANNRMFQQCPRAHFTSMFVERMEVLEHCQKFEGWLSTFPDSKH